MDKRKILLVLIFAALLAFVLAISLTAFLRTKPADKNIEVMETVTPAKNIQTESGENVQSESDTAAAPVKQDVKTLKTKTNYKLPKSSSDNAIPAEKAGNTVPVTEEENVIGVNLQKSGDDSENIVVPCEFKFKSPAKYTFK